MFGILFFVLGLIVGSFLNVVILRHGTGMGLGGRSRCSSTGNVLHWYELIPVVSFIMQKGRSRYDRSKISWQYPLVELTTGLLFLLSFCVASPYFFSGNFFIFVTSFLFFVLCSCFIVAISFYDIKHMIIPNEFSYPLIIISFTTLFVSLGSLTVFSIPSPEQLLAGPLVALPFVLLWFISKGKWMGFADAKIGLAIGWFLGISSGLAAIIISFWFGAVVAILILMFQKYRHKKQTLIPLGPFLLTGLIVSFLYTIDMNTLVFLFI